MQIGLEAVAIKIPKVRSKTDKSAMFQSVLVPPYVHKAHAVVVSDKAYTVVKWPMLEVPCRGHVAKDLFASTFCA